MPRPNISVLYASTMGKLFWRQYNHIFKWHEHRTVPQQQMSFLFRYVTRTLALFICTFNQSINQSISIWVRQKPIHTNTHAHTYTQNTTTMYNKRNKKETVEMKHIYIVRCQIQLTFLTRLFTEQFNLVVRRTRTLWSRVEKHGNPSSKSITVTLLNFA